MNGKSDPLVGQTFAGRFEIADLIGTGGMGRVYMARQHGLDRTVAIKTMKVEPTKGNAWILRFTREAQVTSRIDHPSVVKVHDFGQDDATQTHYIVMEFIEGMTAQGLVAKRGPLPTPHVIHIGTRVLSALEAAHEAGIVHRDIKPSNIMLTTDGLVKVCDFGIAKVLDDGADEARLITLTKKGMVLGTFAYMSPEQARGEKVDPRSDVFSLGSTLYKLFTGQRPFTGASPAAMLNALLMDDPPPMVGPEGPIDPPLEAIVRRALARNPSERYRSARSMEKALLRYMRDKGAPRPKPAQIAEATVVDRPARTRELSETPSSPMPTPSQSLSETPLVPPTRTMAAPLSGSQNRLTYFFGAIALVAIVALVVVQFRSTPPPAPGDPLVRMSDLVTEGGYGAAETYFLEHFDELQNRHDAAVLARVLLGMRRDAEHGAVADPRWSSDFEVAPASYSGTVAMRGRGDEILAIAIEDVREATFTGTLRFPDRGAALSIAGLHDGNHILFWNVAMTEGKHKPFPLRDKLNALLTEDAMIVLPSTYFEQIQLPRNRL